MALLFSLLIIGTALTPYQGTGTVGKLPWVGLLATVLVYIQSLLGALVASQWALHVLRVEICVASYSHIGAVVPPILALVFLSLAYTSLHPALRQLANLAGADFASRVGLRRSGYICKWSRLSLTKQWEPLCWDLWLLYRFGTARPAQSRGVNVYPGLSCRPLPLIHLAQQM